MSWFSLLDWSVYHAPGAEEWQAFRRDQIGKPGSVKLQELHWWLDTHTSDRMAQLVRVTNLVRSNRGIWYQNPEWREWHDELTAELRQHWGRE